MYVDVYVDAVVYVDVDVYVCGDQEFQEKSEPLLLHLDSTYTSLCAMLPSCYRDAHGKFFCSVSFGQCLFLYVSLPPSSEHKNARFPLKRTHSQKGIAPTKSAHFLFLHFRLSFCIFAPKTFQKKLPNPRFARDVSPKTFQKKLPKEFLQFLSSFCSFLAVSAVS